MAEKVLSHIGAARLFNSAGETVETVAGTNVAVAGGSGVSLGGDVSVGRVIGAVARAG
jgi:hypothetical protein